MAEFKNYGPLFDLVNKQLKLAPRELKNCKGEKKFHENMKKVSFFDKLFGVIWHWFHGNKIIFRIRNNTKSFHGSTKMAKTHFSGNHCAWRGNKAWKEAANIYVNKSNAFCHSYSLPIVNKQLPCKNVHHSVEIYEFPHCVGSLNLKFQYFSRNSVI